MTRSILKFTHKLLVFSINLGKTLLGFYFFLLEISESREGSIGRCWDGSVPSRARPTATPTTTTTCRPIDFLPSSGLAVQVHSAQMKLVVGKGENVFLPCRVLNLGENQILWRHGTNIIAGSNITTTSPDRIRLLPDFTLQLMHVTESEDGVYECFVTTRPPLKLIHTLRIAAPPTLSIEPDTGSVDVTEGDSVQIGCIPQGNPTPKITWTKREGIIPSDRRAVFTSTSLTLYNVSPRETGLYECKADNGIGRPAVGTIYVRVRYAPEVKTPNRIVHGGVKYRATLMCAIHADPLPEVQWLFGGKPVSLTKRVQAESRGSEHYLVFSSIREKDFGLYICSANNSLGFDLRYVELSGVSNPPVVTRWETSSCEPRRKNEARVEAESTKTMMTSQNGNQILGSRRSCTVHVSLYWAVECYSPLIDYRLIFRSVKTDQDQLVNSFNEDRVLPWTELNIPADPAFAFINTKSFIIHGLEEGHTYEGALRARNKYGTSHLSSVFYFSTVPNSSFRTHELRELFPNVPDAERSNNSEGDNDEDDLDTPFSAANSIVFTRIPAVTHIHYLLVLFYLI